MLVKNKHTGGWVDKSKKTQGGTQTSEEKVGLSEVVGMIEDWWKETKEDMKKELPKLFKPVMKKFEEEIRKSEREKCEKEIADKRIESYNHGIKNERTRTKKQVEGLKDTPIKEVIPTNKWMKFIDTNPDMMFVEMVILCYIDEFLKILEGKSKKEDE